MKKVLTKQERDAIINRAIEQAKYDMVPGACHIYVKRI